MTKKVALECALCAVKNWELKEYRMADENTTFTADEVVAKLNEMWDALNKKSSGEKPLTEQQKQNLGYKGDILAVLADGKARTATELMKEVPTFPEDMSNQRVNALVRQLLKAELVDRTEIKGRAYFHKPGLEVEEVKGE
jgi:hypothetical protein